MSRKYDSIEDLKERAEEGKSVPFKDLDKHNRRYLLKGGVGQMIEESLFEYKVNSNSEPDFENLGIELKVTPFIKDKKGQYKAKERLVLNIINYMEENLDSFYDSHFWHKNAHLLIMFYQYFANVPRDDWFIDDFIFYNWPEKDKAIIMKDWETIVAKIKAGDAQNISETDTLYLAACTKGATAAKSLREQPYSKVKAKQRAYSLKPSYMTYVLNHYVYGDEKDEAIIKSSDVLKNKSFEEVIQDMFKPYIGKTQKELLKMFEIGESKASNYSIINHILQLNGDVRKTEEFQKANIIPKTIRIETNGSIKESMSFPAFSFQEIIQQDWEDSDFCNTISGTRFLFLIFQKVDAKDENSYFKGAKFWGMPQADIDEAEKCWNQAVRVIREGVIISPSKKEGEFHNNLPKSTENRVAHVRPHTKCSYYNFGDYEKGNPKDGDQLPDGRWMTKQGFWLNRAYVKKVVHDLISE